MEEEPENINMEEEPGNLHSISYPYIDECVFHTVLRFQKLIDQESVSV